MTTEIVPSPAASPSTRVIHLPALIAREGERTAERFIEFFTANIQNRNTRLAYARSVADFFRYCEGQGIGLHQVKPVMVAAYIEQHPGSDPSRKQSLSAIRMLFDWLVLGQILPMNPASSVRGPKHVVRKGKTPVLDGDQARQLLESIDATMISGLRDRALIGVMVYSFARVGAVVGMDVGDYFATGKRWALRLHEKGGKHHEVPAHHTVEEYLDAYLAAGGIADQSRGPLFRTIDRHRTLTTNRMHRNEVLAMIKRRARAAKLPESTCCHTFRATGITVYLSKGGTIEKAQQIAGHESPRTTKLYDRTSDQITLDEIERIVL